jgi:NAD(P)H-dependent flavin oxidoreductase YrpB (nitropropane dioxygenase family)
MKTAFTDLVGVPHPIVGFNRSPGVVAAVTNAGGFGVLAASAYTPAELDAQLTWIEDQTGGKPYGVDLLVPEKFVPGGAFPRTGGFSCTATRTCANGA